MTEYGIRSTYVPNNYGIPGPLHSGLEVRTKANMVIEEFQQGIALLLFVPNNVAGDYKSSACHQAQ